MLREDDEAQHREPRGTGERGGGQVDDLFAQGAGRGVELLGFWSVTLYNEHHFFHRDDLRRYSLGTKNTTLRPGPDGSLTLYAGARPPAEENLPNWLPAPAGRFALYLRAYWPDPTALDGTWRPPAVVRTLPAAM